jgi:hypothetical protein
MRPSQPPTQEHGLFYKAQFGSPRRRPVPPLASPRLAPVLGAAQRVELEVRLERELAIAMPPVAVPEHGPPSTRFSPLLAPEVSEMPQTEVGVVAGYLLPQISRGDATPALVDVTLGEVTRLLSSREPELGALLGALHVAVRQQRAAPAASAAPAAPAAALPVGGAPNDSHRSRRDSSAHNLIETLIEQGPARSARDVSFRSGTSEDQPGPPSPRVSRRSDLSVDTRPSMQRDWKAPALTSPYQSRSRQGSFASANVLLAGASATPAGEAADRSDEDDDEAEIEAATILQAGWRGTKARRKCRRGRRSQVERAQRRVHRYSNAAIIQRHALGRLERTAPRREMWLMLSVRRIQRAWRARCAHLAENLFRRSGICDPIAIERLNRLRAELCILGREEVCVMLPLVLSLMKESGAYDKHIVYLQQARLSLSPSPSPEQPTPCPSRHASCGALSRLTSAHAPSRTMCAWRHRRSARTRRDW